MPLVSDLERVQSRKLSGSQRCQRSEPTTYTHGVLVRQLALQYPPSPLFAGPLLIYLTARDATRGQAAVAELLRDEQLLDAKALVGQGGATEIRFRQLDIADVDGGAAEKFADFVAKEHPEGIDFLINNAAVAMNGFGERPPPPRRQSYLTDLANPPLFMSPANISTHQTTMSCARPCRPTSPVRSR